MDVGLGGGLRGKLERLMLFRVVMVTLLLGSALVVNVDDADGFSDPALVVIFGLIIFTYVATIVYAVLVRRVPNVAPLAYAQILGDVLVTGGLVLVTGGIQSIFGFLMFLTIINGAILMGRNAGLVTATACSALFVGLFSVQVGWLPSPEWLPLAASGELSRSKLYTLAVNVVAFYLVGFLAGYLAKRLEEQGDELERRELDIQELQALNQNILASIHSGVITIDSAGRVLFINRAAEEVLGRSLEGSFGRLAQEALPELKVAFGRVLEVGAQEGEGQEALEGGELVLWEGWVEAGEDQEPVFVSVGHSRLYDGQGQPYGHILVLQDLTLVHRMRSHVQRQERLAAVGQLAAAIAHEIRNPLASISGSVEMLKMLSSPGEDEARLMNIVIREIDRLNGLIGGFLEYTRSRRRSRVTVSLYDVIQETAEMFQLDRQLLGEVRLQLDVEACKAGHILADVEGMRQVFWNLLRNAAQAMDGRGEIHVQVLAMRTANLPDGRQGLVRPVQEGEEAQGYRILVSDDGPGIPAEVQERIFEPFFTTKRDGTGLGLATTYRIIEDHDGSIQVQSAVGEGTTFVIDLPLRQQPIGAVLASNSALGLNARREAKAAREVSSEEAPRVQ